MKKYLLFFLFSLIVLPLNAQRIVKYVSFYPIPYGSHQTIKVLPDDRFANSGKAVINSGGTPSCNSYTGEGSTAKCLFPEYTPTTTNIGGILSIALPTPEFSATDNSYFAGKLVIGRRDDIYAISGADFNNDTFKLYSGNGSSGTVTSMESLSSEEKESLSKSTTYITGPVDIVMDGHEYSSSGGDATIKNVNTPKFDHITAGTAVLKPNMKYSSSKVTFGANPSGCAGTGVVKSLRLQGSEECKYYIVCSSSGATDKSCSTNRCSDYGVTYCFNKDHKCVEPDKPSSFNGWSFDGSTFTASCSGNITGATGGSITVSIKCYPFKGWTKKSDYTYNYSCTCQKGYYWSTYYNKCLKYSINSTTYTSTFKKDGDKTAISQCETALNSSEGSYYGVTGKISWYDCPTYYSREYSSCDCNSDETECSYSYTNYYCYP